MTPTPRRPWYRRLFGTQAERAAARFLKAKGHRVITRNWSCALGELDLITRDGQTLVFVEVRSTQGPDTLAPAASVDEEKQQRLTRLALAFVQKHNLWDVPARFDVIAISWPERRRMKVDHYPAAFQLKGRFQIRS